MHRTLFLKLMAERRSYSKDSMEYEWRTNAARKHVWIMRGIPVCEWPE